jgi:hypothetical protein
MPQKSEHRPVIEIPRAKNGNRKRISIAQQRQNQLSGGLARALFAVS